MICLTGNIAARVKALGVVVVGGVFVVVAVAVAVVAVVFVVVVVVVARRGQYLFSVIGRGPVRQ